MNGVRSEWIKLVSVLSHRIITVIAVLGAFGLSVLVTVIVPADQLTTALGPPTRNDLFALAIGGINVCHLLMATLGVLVATQEFRFTGRLTFAGEPRRPRIVVAKVVVTALTALVVGVLAVVPTLLVGGAVLRARDLGFEFGGAGFWRAVAGQVVVVALYALAGLAVGLLLRSSALAITLLVVWVLVIESALVGLLPKVGKFAPFTAGGSLGLIDPQANRLAPWAGGALLLAVVAALMVAATLLLVRRDV